MFRNVRFTYRLERGCPENGLRDRLFECTPYYDDSQIKWNASERCRLTSDDGTTVEFLGQAYCDASGIESLGDAFDLDYLVEEEVLRLYPNAQFAHL